MFNIFRNRIFIAVLIALVAMVLTYNVLVAATDRVNIVLVNKEVQAFDVINDNMLTSKLISEADKQALFPDAFKSKAEIVGAVAKERIPANTVLQKNNMFIVGGEAQKMIGINNKVEPKYLIPEDYRAVAVNVDSEGSVGQILRKNDIVDVVFTSKDESTGGIYSKTILQHITIFDIESVEETGSKYKCVMLLVNPKHIPMLVAAKRNGKIDLLLNPDDPQSYTDQPFTITSLTPPQTGNLTAMIDDIMADVIAIPTMTSAEKNTILLQLEEGKKFDNVYNSIVSSSLSPDKKEKILDILKK